jgi:hypothetical protein
MSTNNCIDRILDYQKEEQSVSHKLTLQNMYKVAGANGLRRVQHAWASGIFQA